MSFYLGNKFMNNKINRRDFAKNLAYSTLGVSVLGETLGKSANDSNHYFGKAKHAIIITLSGGISHVDSFDPKEKDTNGGIKPISTNVEGINVSQYFPGIAKHADKYSILRSMTSKNGSHEGSTYQLKTSYNRSAQIIHPTIGPIRSFLKGKIHKTLPDTILIGTPNDHPKQGYLDAKYTPLPIYNPEEGIRYSKIKTTDENINNRMRILHSMNDIFNKTNSIRSAKDYTVLYDDAIKAIKSDDIVAFDLTKESVQRRESYGMNPFGQGCLLATRLIDAGISVIELNIGGWDNHNDIVDNMKSRTPILDKALAALFNDLTVNGKIKETLIVVESEFGRTPVYREDGKLLPYSKNNGRDHFVSAFSCIIGGCGIGGKIIGKTDAFGETIEDRPISFGELNSTIAYMLGIKHDQIWLSPPESSSPGRPFTIGNGAKPIIEIIM